MSSIFGGRSKEDTERLNAALDRLHDQVLAERERLRNVATTPLPDEDDDDEEDGPHRSRYGGRLTRIYHAWQQMAGERD